MALVILLIFFVLTFTLLRPWLQGFLAGTPVSIMALIGMRLRRIDVQTVMRSLLLARHSSVQLSHHDLQRAYLRGVDLEKVTLAYIHASQRGLGETFEDLVNLELQGRLAEKLEV
jgi:uncharacterized protein YqfA (UPF0365 family)